MKLRRGCLVLPMRGECETWGLLLSPSEHAESSSIRMLDDPIMGGYEQLRCMGRLFQSLCQGFPAERVWEFDNLTVARRIQKSANFVGVESVPYQLRRSGFVGERLLHHNTSGHLDKKASGDGHEYDGWLPPDGSGPQGALRESGAGTRWGTSSTTGRSLYIKGKGGCRGSCGRSAGARLRQRPARPSKPTCHVGPPLRRRGEYASGELTCQRGPPCF